MTDLRHKPGAFAQSPRGKNGLVGRAAIDMPALNPWGSLAAYKQGSSGHWWFECAEGHDLLLAGATVRQQVERGTPMGCPKCAGKVER